MNKNQKHINKLVKIQIGKGIRYFNIGQYEKAVEKFSKAIELNPDNANAYKNRGDVYFITEPQKAIIDCTKAIELKPNYISAYELRAMTYCSLLYNEQNKTILDYTSILSDYATILKINPKYYKAYQYRGDVYRKFQQYDLSIKDYTKAIELKSDKYRLYISRGYDYFQIQQYDNAIEDFKIATTSNNYYEEAECYTALAKIYYILKDYNKANEYYTEANKIQKSYHINKVQLDLSNRK